MKIAGSAVTAALIALTLAACSSRQEATLDCPRASIVDDLGTTLRFRDGPGRDLSDVVYAAQLRDITGECVYDRRGVRVDMNVVVLGERGPAAQAGSRSGEVEYFVAILDPRETILAKERFTSRLDFAAGQERVAIREELEQRIPLPQGVSAQDYRILVGFQMNPEEAELVRRHRQGRR